MNGSEDNVLENSERSSEQRTNNLSKQRSNSERKLRQALANMGNSGIMSLLDGDAGRMPPLQTEEEEQKLQQTERSLDEDFLDSVTGHTTATTMETHSIATQDVPASNTSRDVAIPFNHDDAPEESIYTNSVNAERKVRPNKPAVDTHEYKFNHITQREQAAQDISDFSRDEILTLRSIIRDYGASREGHPNPEEFESLLGKSPKQASTDWNQLKQDTQSETHESDKSVDGLMIDNVFGKLETTTRMLEEDTFGFMISSKFLSIPWLTGLSVVILETCVFILILFNSVDIRGSRDNPLGIPASVSPQVTMAQFAAIFIAVASQDDIRSAIKYFFEGYHRDGIGAAFVGSKTRAQWLFAVMVQFIEGSLGILATFFLVVTSDAVIDLLLNFTAVEFVTLLDNNAFVISRQGFLGRKNKMEAEIVAETEYSLPRSHKITPKGQIITLIVTFAFVMIGWIMIYVDQLRGRYTVKTLYVQFDDSLSKGLGAYSGFYNLNVERGSVQISRIRYIAEKGEGYFGYCSDNNVWTFSLEGDSPCDNPVMKSPKTNLFDIMKVADGKWYVTKDADEQQYFPMNGFHLDAGCIEEEDCGGVGRGTCKDNRCYCEDEYFGARCLYTRSDVCETIAINEEFPTFQGNREFSSEFHLLRDDNDEIIEAYHHPVYYYSASDGGLEVMIYMGLRWGLTADLAHSLDDLRVQLTEHPFHAVHDLPLLEFYSETVSFNTPLDTSSPIIQSWTKVEPTGLSKTSQIGPVLTRLLCGICSVENPCRYDNVCGADGRCVQSCSAEGECVCGNGAYGRLCQTAPLGDGKCDNYFNVPSYRYDGGDCCQGTCVNSETHTCGVINVDTIEHVTIGFPYCVDPLVIDPECADKSCWAPLSRSLPLLSVENTALIHLSANGLVIAVAEPALDAVRVFDHEDSRWSQRGSILEGPVGSNFGKSLSVNSLPGAVVGRRVGKVPIVVAIGLNGVGEAGVHVVRWEPNDLDWRAVGDVLDICVDIRNTCDLKGLDIVRREDRVTLSVVRSDNFGLVYRHTLSETGNNPWILQYYSNGADQGDLPTLPAGSYHSTSVSPVGLAGSGNVVIFSYGLIVEYMDVTDDESFLNDGNRMSNAQNLRRFVNPDKLAFTFDNPHVATDLIAIGQYWDWDPNVSYQQVGSLKMSPDGKKFLTYTEVGVPDAPPGTQTYIFVLYEFVNLHLTALWAKNFTSPVLSGPQLDDGITAVKFSADASSFAIREYSTNGTNSIRLMKFDSDKLDFFPVGLSQEDQGGDMSLSYDGTVFFQSLVGADQAFGVVPKCGSGVSSYRLAITLDEKPENLVWTMETYQSLGPMFFGGRLIRSCDGCYFDNDRFGKGVVAEDICVPRDIEGCSRLRFEPHSGFRPGAGMVLYRDGEEVFVHTGNSTDESLFYLDDSEGCEIDELECGEDESHVLLSLRFDTFPDQTSWTMEDSSGRLIGSGGNYSVEFSNKRELIQMCGPKGDDYRLVVEDLTDFPDGICCGKGDGGYDVYVDFVKMYSREGERSFRFDTVVFNSDGVVEEPVAVTLEFQLDQYSDETLWQIELPDYTLLYFHFPYENQPNALVTETVYLSPGQEYILLLRDLVGDGFCCSFGNGYYNIYDGDVVDPSKVLVSGTGEFVGNWFEVFFSVPDKGITSTLTPALIPTLAPSSNVTV